MLPHTEHWRQQATCTLHLPVAIELSHLLLLLEPSRLQDVNKIEGNTMFNATWKGGKAMAQSSTGTTGTRDETYDLVSILYHALQGAETYDQYISDAEQRGDKDLAQFIRDTKEEDQRRADRAKQLLAKLLK
jgi:hypothetical protein